MDNYLWDLSYGVYDVKDGFIHHAGMNKEQARKWIEDAPSPESWALCRAQWTPVV